MVHKKNKKGITPVIALVMLMLITVGIVGVSSTWFSGIFSSQTKKFISIPAGGAYCTDGDIKVYALNSGDSAITASDIIVAQVDGNDVKGTPFFGNMNTGLVGWWKFDEATGVKAFDSSGIVPPNDGDLKPACPNCPMWIPGKSRNALRFDGTDDYVTVPDSANLRITQEITISAWVNTNVLKWDRLIQKYAAPSDGNIPDYSLAQNGGWGCEFDNGAHSGSSYKQIFDTTPPNIGVWYHVACTGSKSGNYFKVYVNGVQKASTSWFSIGDIGSASWNLDMGRSRDLPFNGLIDELKIYNKANGDINIQPSGSGLVINYPGVEGRHSIRVGTSSGVAESTVTCS